jgi:hypothetical protein
MATLMTLPNELIFATASYLPTADIHALILTNRRFHALLERSLYQNATPRDIARMLHRNDIVAFRRAILEGVDLTMEIGPIKPGLWDRKQPLLAWVAWKRQEPEFLRLVLANVDVSKYGYLKQPRHIWKVESPLHAMAKMFLNSGIPAVSVAEMGTWRPFCSVPGGLLFLPTVV